MTKAEKKNTYLFWKSKLRGWRFHVDPWRYVESHGDPWIYIYVWWKSGGDLVEIRGNPRTLAAVVYNRKIVIVWAHHFNWYYGLVQCCQVYRFSFYLRDSLFCFLRYYLWTWELEYLIMLLCLSLGLSFTSCLYFFLYLY